MDFALQSRPSIPPAAPAIVSSVARLAGDTVVVADAGTAARCCVVRALSAAQLPHTGAARLAHVYVSDHTSVIGGVSAGAILESRDCHAKFVRPLAFGTLLIATFPFSARTSAGKLEVSILDVGQGDSLLVVSPGGKTLLIDGGGASGGFPGHEQARGVDPGEDAVSPYLWGRALKKIDVVALTHAHQDHLGGLIAILENFRVGRLWIGREVKARRSPNWNRWREKETFRWSSSRAARDFLLTACRANFCGLRSPMQMQR
jgi:beta-lactamase superfamily II metal-dependent hydrolase